MTLYGAILRVLSAFGTSCPHLFFRLPISAHTEMFLIVTALRTARHQAPVRYAIEPQCNTQLIQSFWSPRFGFFQVLPLFFV